MTKNDFIAKLQQILSDVSKHIAGKEEVLLGAALAHYNQVKPKIVSEVVGLIAGQSDYILKNSAVKLNSINWQPNLNPWHSQVVLPHAIATANSLMFDFSITPAIINQQGSSVRVNLAVDWSLEELNENATEIVLIRAQAEAIKLDAIRKSTKPVRLRTDGSGKTTQDNPLVLYDKLMAEFKERVYAY
jgi:hypothetical protein